VVDGIGEGFAVFLVSDCVRGVNLRRTDSATAFREMVARGARTVPSKQLLKSLGGRAAVSSSS
jgi:nicotinamidase-related amidase